MKTYNVPFIKNPIFRYFLWVYLLAIPFIVAGLVIKTPDSTPLALPASAIMFIVPAVVAVALAARANGAGGVKRLLARLKDQQIASNAPWYLGAFLTMPLIAVAVYLVLNVAGVTYLAPQIDIVSVAILLLVFGVAAAFEEIGWMGYAFDSMQNRWGVIGASLLLGLLWAVMHIVPWVQVHGIMWTLGWALFSVSIRVPMTWFYIKTGRTLLPVVLLHAMINVVVAVLPGFNGNAIMAFAFAGVSFALAIVAAAMLAAGPKRRLAKPAR